VQRRGAYKGGSFCERPRSCAGAAAAAQDSADAAAAAFTRLPA
jgi:hypothetical protein